MYARRVENRIISFPLVDRPPPPHPDEVYYYETTVQEDITISLFVRGGGYFYLK